MMHDKEYLSVTSQKEKKLLFFSFQRFENHISVEHDENLRSQNSVGIGSWRPEKWPHEYLSN